MKNPPRVVPLVLMTTVAVVGVYDLLLLWPATTWLQVHAFADSGDALAAPAQFIVDAHWFLLLAVVITHGGAALGAHRRFGVAACVAVLVFSGVLTAFWVWATHLPFFAIAGAIK